MEESVFFNLGNLLASSKDDKELIRTAQIEHDKRKGREKLVIVEDPQSDEQLLFNFSDAETQPTDNNQSYTVKKVIK